MTPGRFPKIALSAVMVAARSALGQRFGSLPGAPTATPSAFAPTAEPAQPAQPAADQPPAPPTAASTATPAEAIATADLPGNVPWLVRHLDVIIVAIGTVGLIASVGLIIWDAADFEPELPRAGGPSLPFVCVLATAVLWAIYLFWKVPEWQAASRKGQAGMGPKELFDIENAARGTIGQMLGGVAVITGLLFAWQQLGNTTETLQASQEGQLTERFTRAVDQISADDLTVRLGGIYALEQIARESARNYPTVMEVLTAFVRQNAPLQAGADPGTPMVVASSVAPDVQAVLTVIGRRDASRDGAACLNLGYTKLSTANLIGANLSHVCFNNSDLSDANLSGADLTDADLDSARMMSTILIGTNLTRAQMVRTELVQAGLREANLTDANLQLANFSGSILYGAILRGANLLGANFSGAILFGADLTNAELIDATMAGAVLYGANLEGARHLTQAQIDSASTDDTTKLPPLVPATPGT